MYFGIFATDHFLRRTGVDMAGIISRLRVFDHNDLQRIHDGSMHLLGTLGVKFECPEALEIFRAHGAKVDDRIVYIPEEMVEGALESAPKSFRWHARDPEKTVRIGRRQRRTHVALNNGPIYIDDLEKGRRLGTWADLENFYRLAQASTVCTVVGQIPVAPSDMPQAGLQLKMMQALLRSTDKPLFGWVSGGREIEQMLEMVRIAHGGGADLFEQKALLGVSVNPLSPLVFNQAPCDNLIAFARRRQPVLVLTCAMSGVTAPVRLMGTVLQQNAEILAGLVLTQLINPGTPFIYSPASAVPNMRLGSYIGGSPESNLINIAGIQLADELYDLPCRAMAALTDAKCVDCQAGLETMQNLFMLLSAGVHLVNESLGILDSIMTMSYEKFLLDEEMLSRLLTVEKGMDTSEAALSLDTITEVGHGGSFLTHPSTLRHCRDAWQPMVSHWGSYEQWEKEGRLMVVERAHQIVTERLAACPETLLSPDLERDLEHYVESQS
jgi:trimethylamine--corrinoid protein Co-methyltransferase